MKFCADTWFILKLFNGDTESTELLKDVKFGKDELIIPITTIAESYKKFFGQGVTEIDIEHFLDSLQIIEKIHLINLDKSFCKEAAKVSLSFEVPIMDSFVAATARLSKCHFVLSDDEDKKNCIEKNI